MSIVVCKLPKTGLGNQLFPLMKALVFAELNDLPVVVTGYHQVKIGPYLRREKTKRNYKGYFTFQKNILLETADKISLLMFNNYEKIIEPPLVKIDKPTGKRQYFFSEMSHWSDYFLGLKDHRELVLKIWEKILSPAIKGKISLLKTPVIGAHIRMGDFRKLSAGQNFAAAGTTRTPEDYFVEMIESIRKIAGKDLPVTIFTDGFADEFKLLPSLNNIQFSDNNPDLVDLVILSRSKLIITSATSTFSYWAGFLSKSPVIMHPDHLHADLRNEAFNKRWYEGPLIPALPVDLLVSNIRAIE